MTDYRLGDLQLRIMQVLWERGGQTVADVHEALQRQSSSGHSVPAVSSQSAPESDRSTLDRPLAYTTVATMLRKMEDRGLVSHDSDGRKFVYHASIKADAVTRSMAGHVLDRLFEGSLADLVHHMLTEREVSHAELARLEQLIAERKEARQQTRRGRTQQRGGSHER